MRYIIVLKCQRRNQQRLGLVFDPRGVIFHNQSCSYQVSHSGLTNTMPKKWLTLPHQRPLGAIAMAVRDPIQRTTMYIYIYIHIHIYIYRRYTYICNVPDYHHSYSKYAVERQYVYLFFSGVDQMWMWRCLVSFHGRNTYKQYQSHTLRSEFSHSMGEHPMQQGNPKKNKKHIRSGIQNPQTIATTCKGII